MKEKLCNHDWQPTNKVSKHESKPGTMNFPVKCSKCGAEREQVVDMNRRRRKAINKKEKNN